MQVLDAENARAWLVARGWLASPSATVEALSGGVSNLVLRITPDGGQAFVVKQARRQLRTRDLWLSGLERVWREADAMRWLAPRLPEGMVPRILGEDRQNFAFCMDAAPAGHAVWKQLLLAGQVEPWIAHNLGSCLAMMHAASAGNPDVERQFGDARNFHELRLDPYYRRLAERAPACAPFALAAIEQWPERRACLVHADFSPKNVLVAGRRLVLVDYETVHYGDPGFDLGFFLTHLLLKGIHRHEQFDLFAGLADDFWQAYRKGIEECPALDDYVRRLDQRVLPHLALCMWARIDGTSRIDYLDPGWHGTVREYCLALLRDPPPDWRNAVDRLRGLLHGRRAPVPLAASALPASQAPACLAVDALTIIGSDRIERIHAREVLDSRGRPTVEVEVVCRGGALGRAIVPSGASTGVHEAHELRDADASRYDGLGVLHAVANVNAVLGPALRGAPVADQQAIDRRLCELDGTERKDLLGANAVLGVSLAAARAAAAAKGASLVRHILELWREFSPAVNRPPVPARPRPPWVLGGGPILPLPMVNMISGGLHAGRQLEVQDFLAIPVGARSYTQSLEWVVRVYRGLSRLLLQEGYEGVLVGDEGGFGPRLPGHERALDLLVRAIQAAGLRPGPDVALGLDVASSHFFKQGRYHISSGGRSLEPAAMVELLAGWCADYPIISIEDGAAEDDWDGWRLLTSALGGRVQLIGDDLFVTNPARVLQGAERGIANAVLIKLNQIGTLSETLSALRCALDCGYWPVVSARSGETEDAFIADLAVATGAGQIKIGSVARSERLAKYNQLLRIEEEWGASAAYLGGGIFEPFAAASA